VTGLDCVHVVEYIPEVVKGQHRADGGKRRTEEKATEDQALGWNAGLGYVHEGMGG
jgi:hypothetical protein